MVDPAYENQIIARRIAIGRAPIQSLGRGLYALDMLLNARSLRTTELADALEIDKAGASRILQTLVQAGFAQRERGRHYVPGPKMSAAGKPLASIFGLKSRARPILEYLVSRSGESSHLAILADDQVLYLDKAVPDTMLLVDRPVGTLAPLETTALGRTFLAFGGLPNSALDNARLSTFGPTLERFRSQGYADDNEEYCKGVRCVAAPLRDSNGDMIAAVSLSGPSTRIERSRMAELGALIAEAARNWP